MVQLGRFNTLSVIRQVEFGVYLDGGKLGGILLPSSEVPTDCELGDDLYVFVYLDSHDMPVATLKKPYIQLGEFARLRVSQTNDIGAFLDWGLPKELFLPFAQQPQKVEAGQRVTVFAYLDNSGRLAASAKLDRHFDKTPCTLAPGSEVDLFAWRPTELGYQMIVNHRWPAMLHRQDQVQNLHAGQSVKGYIKTLREDGKLDVMLQPPGYGRVHSVSDQLLEYLQQHQGFCPLHDKSDPEEIKRVFGVSKKAFKMAIGQLLKQGKLVQDEQGLHLRG